MSFTHMGQYRELHSTSVYGASSAKVAPFLIPHIQRLAPQSVIDYGCGQSALGDRIESAGVPDVCRYDPAIPVRAERPARTFDLLISIDVLEHVPESELDEVISDMRSMAQHAMPIIDIKPATQILPNGENAHATIKPPHWWRERLSRHYDYLEPFSAKPRDRARFKTWPTPASDRPLIWAHTALLGLRRRIAKRLR